MEGVSLGVNGRWSSLLFHLYGIHDMDIQLSLQ
jgi:hypothetical protein